MTSEFATAVHALVYLHHKNKCICSERLAENICTHPARIRKIMAKLKRAGLIEAKEGLDGGYQFCLNAKEVTLGQICRAMETPPVSVTGRTGDVDMDCLIASGMAAVMDDVYSRLNDHCLALLDTIPLSEIDRRIFCRD